MSNSPATHHRRWYRGIAAAAVTVLIGFSTPLAAAADGPAVGTAGTAAQQPAAAGVGTTATLAEARAADSYWTEERMRAATPQPQPDLDSAAQSPTAAQATQNALAPESAPGTAPTRGKLAASASASASDSIGPLAVSVAQRWGNQGQMPATTVGKLYFTRTDGTDGYCSGSVITAANFNTVWTAGHCVQDGGAGAGNYYSDFVFVPDTDNGLEPHGRWTWKYVNTTVGWQDDNDLAYDIAAIAFYPQSQRGDLASWTGSQGYKFGYGQDFDDVHFFGFPQDGYERTDFTGDDLWYCQGATEDAGLFSSDIEMECDMHHGASGGPWLEDLQTSRGWGYIIGAYSYREVDDAENPTDIYAYSANHGDGAINVYNDVSVQ